MNIYFMSDLTLEVILELSVAELVLQFVFVRVKITEYQIADDDS